MKNEYRILEIVGDIARFASVAIFFLLLPVATRGAVVVSQEELIKGAKKEGRLIFYASGTVEQTKMFLDAFQLKYPLR